MVRGRAILEGVGGDILNPRGGGGAYDDMLRALHDVVELHDSPSNYNSRAMFVTGYYHYLDEVVDGATPDSIANLLDLSWNRSDWKAEEGRFNSVNVFGSNPLYQLAIETKTGQATVVDYEQGKRRRIGQLGLVSMTRGITSTDIGNLPDNRYLTNGYVIVPEYTHLDIRDKNGEVNGDSVRRALDPYEAQLAKIATSLCDEAQFVRQAQEVKEREAAKQSVTKRNPIKSTRQAWDELDRKSGGL